MKRHLISFIVFLFTTARVLCQGVPDSAKISLGYPVYSQYLQNGLVINPAYAGSRGVLSSFLSYRVQWMGTKGSPLLQSLSLHTPMKDDKVALGLLAQFMQYGLTKSTSIYGDYAYHIRLRNGKVSFGLKAGTDISNTDYTGLLLTDTGDPVFSSNDKPYVLPNVGAGVYYMNDRIFAGLAIPAFLNYKKSAGGSTQVYHSFKDYDFVISAGGLVEVSPILKIKPSILIDFSFQKTKRVTQFDINTNFIIADLVWAGASWRSSEQVVVGIVQLQINPQLLAGLSYDYPYGRMHSFSKGSSEFILRYEFGYKISASNPRYF
jgi:type IX secretion system PorP/SprF family membrane protein